MPLPKWDKGRFPDYEMLPAAYLKTRSNKHGIRSNLIERTDLEDEEVVVQDDHGRSLGKPTAKNQFDRIDIVATFVSMLSLLAGLVVVANERVSWQLGTSTYQLVIVGFLLSIMNICLTSISPSFFLVLEARFGSSTLQNYEGLLRNHMLKSQMSLVWRIVLGCMLLLPLGLSVAYKAFLGGSSELSVSPHEYIGNSSYYGLFAIPGSGNLGRRSGVSMFANATLPFLQAISTNGKEPSFPSGSQAYGFNHLILNRNSAAFLDIPQTNYISKVQQVLRPGESWTVTASVTGTVAKYNALSDALQVAEICEEIEYYGYDEDYRYSWWYLEALRDFNTNVTINGTSVTAEVRPFVNLGLMNLVPANYWEPTDFSTLYLGFAYGLVPSYKNCSSYLDHIFEFSVARHKCIGKWLYTRTTVRLLEGTCEKDQLPPNQQLIVTQSPLIIGRWYMASYCEIFGLFAWDRNTSDWKIPAFATAVAASIWSRSYALYGADTPESGDLRVEKLKTLNLGTVYQVTDKVVYTRPTMQKSALLYFVLAIQPLICMAMIIGKSVLYTTPIGRGFGLTSILSGLDSGKLEHLKGAALSGELSEEVKIVISPRTATSGNEVDYKIFVGSEHVRNGRLRKRAIYS